MAEDESLNETVASFNFKKRKYEIDVLKDADYMGMNGAMQSMFDIFDVTDEKAVSMIQFNFSKYSNRDELIEEAKKELTKLL